MDPRNGARLAALVRDLMAPPACEHMRASMTREVERFLDAAEARGFIDAVEDLAEPLALSSIGKLLGVPEDDRTRFERIARALLGRFFAVFDPRARMTPEVSAFASYVGELFAWKQAEPGEDIISAILEAARSGDAIVEADYLPFTAIFLYAGHENMANFLALSILSLMRFPREWERLRDEPFLIRNAVEELLRFESPVQIVSLAATKDFSAAGGRIAAGETVLAAIGAANRDPERFANPSCLDVRRSPIPHLSFGAGALHCVGAWLARLEAQITLKALTGRFECPPLEQSEWQWRSSPAYVRGLARLQIAARVAKVAL